MFTSTIFHGRYHDPKKMIKEYDSMAHIRAEESKVKYAFGHGLERVVLVFIKLALITRNK